MIQYIYVVLSILLTSTGQIFLKIGARNNDTFLRTYFDPMTMTGYFIFLIVTISSILALRNIELKLFYALTSLNYILVMILSKTILKEDFNRNKLISIFLISIGVMIFNYNEVM